MKFKKFLSGLILSTVFLTTISGSMAFSMRDVSHHWAKGHINKMTSRHIVSGYTDGTFKPDDNISREEVSKMMSSYIGGNHPSHNKFSDVHGWSTGHINHLCELGIISGYPDGSFNPTGSLTRAEFSTMIYKYLNSQGKLNETNSVYLSDIGSCWARDNIRAVANTGCFTGYGNGIFKPDDYISRAEVCSVLSKIDDITPVHHSQAW